MDAAAANTPLAERRGPDRAKNVTRPAFKAKPSAASKPAVAAMRSGSTTAKTGADDWASF